MKRIQGKTILLGLGLIMITFSLFFALPAVVPSFGELNCDNLMWGCSHRGIPPINYGTMIWDEEEYPEPEEFSFFGKLDVSENQSTGALTVSGYLMYGRFNEVEIEGVKWVFFGWEGKLGHRNVKITYQKKYSQGEPAVETVTARTDGSGFFTCELSANETVECYTVVANFETEIAVPHDNERPVEIYHDAKAVFSTCQGTFTIKGIPLWVWITIAAICLAVAGYLYRRYRKQNITGNTQRPDSRGLSYTEIEETRKVQKEEKISGGNTDEVAIRFPEIEQSLPAVWEANTTLSIHITFRDRHGNVVPSLPGNVDFGEGDVIQVTTDEDGSIQIRHVYAITGDYTITTGYTDKSGKAVSSWRKVRIVDYREEMVRLFGEMLEELNLADIRIGADMTPREVERLLSERLGNVPKESIRKVIDGFEEANYSTHPVDRERYVRMYKAIREIIGK